MDFGIPERSAAPDDLNILFVHIEDTESHDVVAREVPSGSRRPNKSASIRQQLGMTETLLQKAVRVNEQYNSSKLALTAAQRHLCHLEEH